MNNKQKIKKQGGVLPTYMLVLHTLPRYCTWGMVLEYGTELGIFNMYLRDRRVLRYVGQRQTASAAMEECEY